MLDVDKILLGQLENLFLLLLIIFHSFRIRRLENLKGIKDQLREKKVIKQLEKKRKTQNN